jgi:3-hydroxyisobutyrate dehydrogenase
MGRERVAFIGLGTMGYPMAGHLQARGHEVRVYNRTAAKAEHWVARYGGMRAATPAEAARDASLVFVCVGRDQDVHQVVLDEDGAVEGARAGAIVIDHSTTSASLAKDLESRLASRGVGFLDAPVSGGQAGAESGQLTIMVGGALASYERAEPVLQSYAKRVERMGPAGSGQLTKMVNQICIAGLLQALAEGLRFGERAQLDMAKVIDVIAKGAAQSWQMDNRAKTMLERRFDFGFAVDWMRKDLGICLEQARSMGAELPVTSMVDDRYQRLQARGGGRWDTSSLITLLAADPPAERASRAES